MSRIDEISSSGPGRLYRGQTAIDFFGRRMIGLTVAIVIVVVTVGSLFAQGLNLSLDFEGGQAWDVPESETFGIDEAAGVLEANGVDPNSSTLQRRATAERGDLIAVQTPVVDDATSNAITDGFAAASGTDRNDLIPQTTSASWGSDITEQAVRALVIFLVIVAIFISIRFEWRMALAALAAMAHDVLFAVGVYTVLQFEVSPATVIAFLTILGYSLYDSSVVFDRVMENEGKYAGVRMPYADVVNISMNQVMMRSINTSISSILPVSSLLLIGSGILGAVALREFALALLVGMIAGVYSSIFVASPLLASLRTSVGRESRRERLTGDDLRAAVVGAGVSGRVLVKEESEGSDGDGDGTVAVATKVAEVDAVHRSADRILTHPPRPRKKKRR